MVEGGDQDMKGIAGDLEQFASARLGPFTDHFAHTTSRRGAGQP